MTKIILASNSKQRKILMDSLNINYLIIPSDTDEKLIRDKNLKIRAKKIAIAKAECIADKYKGIIIAADTFSVCQNIILEKPNNLEEAKVMLRAQSNNISILYTGFCYIDNINNIKFSATAITKYFLRNLSDLEIDKFIKNNPVLKWSASFSPAYVYQSTFIEKISGSYSGMVYGLPTEYLIPCLLKSNISIKSD
jgi:septum formation protein